MIAKPGTSQSHNAPGVKRPLVELDRVSKRFTVRLDQQRSFQRSFIRLLQHRSDAGDREFWPLRDVTFDVMQGDCFGIIGPNGSGKSTLLKLVSRILQPTSGRITTHGRVASLLELGSGFHPDLTGRENIFLNASVHGMRRPQVLERLDDIIEFAELGDLIDMPIRHYSSGMYVRLGFAVAIHTDPDVLLVDEVLAVGDVAFQAKCMESIEAFRSRGGTLLLVTHDLHTVQSLCNRAVWLDDGKAQAIGQPTDVVMAYQNHVAEEHEAQAKTERLPNLGEGRRWGSGKVRITKVELCDAAGAPRSVFMSGMEMQVRLTYHADKRIEDPLFGLAIHHTSGTHICGPNSGFGGATIPYAEGEGAITYCVPALSLLEGSYLLSVSSHNRADTEMYDYHDRAYPFRVRPGASREQYGLVTLGGEWIAGPPFVGAVHEPPVHEPPVHEPPPQVER
jgi:ABC-type polysaccharide/polyol phosphate transport system ATPase subunit